MDECRCPEIPEDQYDTAEELVEAEFGDYVIGEQEERVMDRNMTADVREVIKNATALYELYNLFGRGKISEETFCIMYLTGRLEDWIEQTYKCERSE